MSITDSNVIPLRSESIELKNEERETLHQLVNIYADSLKRNLQRFLCPEEDIQDAIQETFYRIIQSGDVNRIQNPSAFLYKMARNILIDRYRKGRLKKNVNEQQRPGSGTASKANTLLDYGEMTVAYEQALSELPEKCRRVFLMRRYDGLTNSEIADILGISMRMVQKYMVRALTHFNKRLR